MMQRVFVPPLVLVATPTADSEHVLASPAVEGTAPLPAATSLTAKGD